MLLRDAGIDFLKSSSRFLILVLSLGASMPAQQSTPPPPPAAATTPASNSTASSESGSSSPSSAAQTNSANATAPTSELTQRDEVTTFKVKVNLVLVRVVARDGKGNPVGGLHKEDFEVLDNGKPQTISQFAIEGPGTRAETSIAAVEAGPATATEAAAPVIPTHFVAYVFDDVHIDFGDLVLLRQAASRHMDTLQPTDRAAIFTTSGQGNLDFTDDREALHKALERLRPTPVARTGTNADCPVISYYIADLIVNKHDANAFSMVYADALSCAFNNDTHYAQAAQNLVTTSANFALQTGEHETRLSLSVFQDILRRIAVMPGQRTMLVLSPGFFNGGLEWETLDLIDRALRTQVVISSLNARGLYTQSPLGDISQPNPTSPAVAVLRSQYQSESDFANDNILRDLSEGTGGTYYHNNNDLFAGFQRIATTPAFYYVLGFSPQNLKLDGGFHKLKVVVKNPPKLSIQARKGYYAPKHVADPSQEAKQEIEDALFSQEEVHDLPVDLHTQFFKASEADAQLAVLVHVDARHLHFNRDQGRNANQLTIVSGLFDRNGRFITANEKVLDLHLKDETLASKLERGLTLKSTFDVKPGAYVVRLVVRDAGGQISAANGAIEIP
jgi:VWFA-related protein